MEIYERVSGARVHASYFCVGGVARDIPTGMIPDIFAFCQKFPARITEIEELLTSNRIWCQRLINVGIFSREMAKKLQCSGPIIRASGVSWDLRKVTPYEVYNRVAFNVPVGTVGDSYDRYLLRIEESRQANQIVSTAENLPSGTVKSSLDRTSTTWKFGTKQHMETVIQHFQMCSYGFCVGVGSTYIACEGPKGEYGVYIIADGTSRPHRCKVRAPGFVHLACVDYMVRNLLIADIVTVIGTLDIVFGEIDR